ncbi:MFS transporter [Halieaceae bacterium IMCC14734]|uniref:MFS transporter n=1 Tax=Candidatus Litorirhabdus singularis TaxID=2518993 RepID=A0ABT3TGT5_9GAMM|nr:MFS transporter [Candidatus Litorirhabdus singularis]MCX2981020.1 MFS transporter [Candidatus Litorirhabdus singularis]
MKFANLPLGTALRLMLPFGFGFYLSMFTRTLSNIVKQPIQAELGMGEEAIGLALGTAFFLAFALAQLPVGILIDRYDPRRVNALLFVLAALGAVVIGMAQTPELLAIGRVMMGVGFAAGLMASLKVYSLWFDTQRLATLNSLQFMIGVLGAWSATKPVELLLRVLDWRELYFLFAAITVLAALLMVLMAPRHDGEGGQETLQEQLGGLRTIFCDGYFWRVSPLMFISMGISQGLGTLYVFSWLTGVAQQDTATAATSISVVTLVSAANFALLGPLAERLINRGYSPMLLPLLGQMLAMALLSLLAVQVLIGAVPQWVLYTMAAGTTTLVFVALSRAFPAAMIGRAYTAFNLLSFLTAALVQWLVGFMLDWLTPAGSNGVAPEAWRWAFLLLVLCQLLGLIWYLMARKLGIGATTMLEKTTNQAA